MRKRCEKMKEGWKLKNWDKLIDTRTKVQQHKQTQKKKRLLVAICACCSSHSFLLLRSIFAEPSFLLLISTQNLHIPSFCCCATTHRRLATSASSDSRPAPVRLPFVFRSLLISCWFPFDFRSQSNCTQRYSNTTVAAALCLGFHRRPYLLLPVTEDAGTSPLDTVCLTLNPHLCDFFKIFGFNSRNTHLIIVLDEELVSMGFNLWL